MENLRIQTISNPPAKEKETKSGTGLMNGKLWIYN